MANPLVDQGTLNLLKASVVFADFPQLNVTAPFLARQGIKLALEGDSVEYLPTMTGGVPSPQPYQLCLVTINLVKTQNLAGQFKAQYENSVLVGNLTVRPDVVTGLTPYDLYNCSLATPREQSYAGDEASWVIGLRGYYLINNTLYTG